MKVGDYLVYPAHGVVKYARLDTREVGGIKRKFMVLRTLAGGMTIMVPEDQKSVDWISLRPLASKAQIESVLATIEDKVSDSKPATTWSARYRDYFERLKTGNLEKVASVIRELTIIRTRSTLSFGERKMFDMAAERLAVEMSLVYGISSEAALARVIESAEKGVA